jgi:hypothetical protein
MKHLSLLTTLLISSSMVYGGWIATGTDYKGDCLEMMCDCVEDSETRDGYCCPNGTSFTNTGNSHPTYTPCKCPENLSWDNTLSQCVECLTDYQKGEGACLTKQKPLCINNICQACPLDKIYWHPDKKICASCLANYGIKTEGACPNKDKPLCDSNFVCQPCPSNKPYFYNGQCYDCKSLPTNQLKVTPTNIVGAAAWGTYTVLDWTTFPVDATLKISSTCIDDYLMLYLNNDERNAKKIWYAYNVYCFNVTPRQDSYKIPANTPFKLKAHDAGVGNVDWIGTMTIEPICD